eukprot:scaffold21865_cov125-Isochrysis_galbana.AAC.2
MSSEIAPAQPVDEKPLQRRGRGAHQSGDAEVGVVEPVRLKDALSHGHQRDSEVRGSQPQHVWCGKRRQVRALPSGYHDLFRKQQEGGGEEEAAQDKQHRALYVQGTSPRLSRTDRLRTQRPQGRDVAAARRHKGHIEVCPCQCQRIKLSSGAVMDQLSHKSDAGAYWEVLAEVAKGARHDDVAHAQCLRKQGRALPSRAHSSAAAVWSRRVPLAERRSIFDVGPPVVPP